MKIIKYELMTEANCGTEEKPNIVQTFTPVTIRCKAEHLEFNEEIAKREAYNGEYTIDDDGQPEPEAPATLENRVETLETDTADMAEALDMILSGVTE